MRSCTLALPSERTCSSTSPVDPLRVSLTTAPPPPLSEYEVLSEKPDGDRCRVDVRLYDRTAPGAPVDFVFNLERQSFGSYKGCWLTKSLLPADSKWLN